jgi:hypothetical protein
MSSENQFADVIQGKIENLDWWLQKLDKAESHQIPGPLYYSIRSFVKAAFEKDFNMIIEDFDFYFKLKP